MFLSNKSDSTNFPKKPKITKIKKNSVYRYFLCVRGNNHKKVRAGLAVGYYSVCYNISICEIHFFASMETKVSNALSCTTLLHIQLCFKTEEASFCFDSLY